MDSVDNEKIIRSFIPKSNSYQNELNEVQIKLISELEKKLADQQSQNYEIIETRNRLLEKFDRYYRLLEKFWL